MRVSSELIVGNALLDAVEQGVRFLDFDYFVSYQKRLTSRLLEAQIDFTIAKLTTYDIMDVAYCARPYLSFDLPVRYSSFRNIRIDAHEGAELNALKSKLNIYYRAMSPSWLLSAIISE
jgi:hypothetical protein